VGGKQAKKRTFCHSHIAFVEINNRLCTYYNVKFLESTRLHRNVNGLQSPLLHARLQWVTVAATPCLIAMGYNRRYSMLSCNGLQSPLLQTFCKRLTTGIWEDMHISSCKHGLCTCSSHRVRGNHMGYPM
jgi:hypothetical protein